MTYQVLARKWRPKKFADLVGQEHVVRALQNAISQGRLHHAYLLTGTRGVGKTTIARILAKSLNCTDAINGEPCGVCSSCTQIDAGRYVDLLEIDAASNTGIDNIREVLENAQYAPTAGRYKIYIIDEVHMLSKSAFNAMLKTLEEPPEHVKFILATTDPHKVPITVLSRCLQFVLRHLNPQQVSGYLAQVLDTENIAYEKAALNLLGHAAMGSMRDGLSLLDQGIALSDGCVTEQDVRHMLGAVDKQYLYAMLQALADHDANALMAQAQTLSSKAVGFDHALTGMATLLQQLAMMQLVPQALSEEPDFAVLQSLSQAFSGEEIQLYYQCVIHGKADLNIAPDEYSGFLMTLLRLLAFKPMAAGDVGLGQNIQGASLSNQNPAPAPAISDTEPKKPSEPVVLDSVQPKSMAKTVVIDNQAPVSNQAAEALLDEQVSSVETLPPWEADVVTTSEPTVEPSHLLNPVEHVTSDAAEIPLDVPELSLENWPMLLAGIRSKLGSAQLLAEHAALIAIDVPSQTLTLALHADAKLWAKRENLLRLSQVISDAYGQNWQIVTEDLTDNNGIETPHQVQLRVDAQTKAQAVANLAQDAVAQSIVETFGGQWLPESIEPMKNH